MELLIVLIILYFIYARLKKSSGIQKKLTDFKAEDFNKLQEQGSADLQKILNNINHLNSKAKHENSYFDTQENKDGYVQNKTSFVYTDEPTVRRRLFTPHNSSYTVIRKDYD